MTQSNNPAQNAYDKFMLHAAEATKLGQESLQGAVVAGGILGITSIDGKEDSAGRIDRIDKVLNLLKQPVTEPVGQVVSRDQVFNNINRAYLLWVKSYFVLRTKDDGLEEAGRLARQAHDILNRIPEEWHRNPFYLRVRVGVKFLLGLSQPTIDMETWGMLISAGDDMAEYLRLIGGLHETPDRLLQSGMEGLIAECGIQLLPVLDQQPQLWKLLNKDTLQKVRRRSQIAIDTCNSLEQMVPAEARDPVFVKGLLRLQTELDKFETK